MKLKGILITALALVTFVSFQNCSESLDVSKLSSTAALPPGIAAQSLSQNFTSKSEQTEVQLFVVPTAEEGAVFTYQWFRNGEEILDAVNAQLVIADVPRAEMVGTYYVEVNRNGGVIRSNDIVIGFTQNLFRAVCAERSAVVDRGANVTYSGEMTIDISSGEEVFTNQYYIGTITGTDRSCGRQPDPNDVNGAIYFGNNHTNENNGDTLGGTRFGCDRDNSDRGVKASIQVFFDENNVRKIRVCPRYGGGGVTYDCLMSSPEQYCEAEFL